VRVLVIDDNAGIRQLVRRLLDESGCCVVVGEAEDGAQAISAVGKHRPDVVIMDHLMPIEDGLVATRRLKRIFPDVDVVGLVSAETPELRAAFAASGAAGFFGKADLARLIDHLVERAGRGSRALSI